MIKKMKSKEKEPKGKARGKKHFNLSDSELSLKEYIRFEVCVDTKSQSLSSLG